MSDKIRKVLKALIKDPRSLERLISEPKAIAKEFKLNRAETTRLEHSDLVIAVTRNPLLETPGILQTTHPITITAGTPHIPDSVDPQPKSLEDLPHERLLEVANRILADPAYAARVRAFLNK